MLRSRGPDAQSVEQRQQLGMLRVFPRSFREARIKGVHGCATHRPRTHDQARELTTLAYVNGWSPDTGRFVATATSCRFSVTF
jgi:hypothetical protein